MIFDNPYMERKDPPVPSLCGPWVDGSCPDDKRRSRPREERKWKKKGKFVQIAGDYPRKENPFAAYRPLAMDQGSLPPPCCGSVRGAQTGKMLFPPPPTLPASPTLAPCHLPTVRALSCPGGSPRGFLCAAPERCLSHPHLPAPTDDENPSGVPWAPRLASDSRGVHVPHPRQAKTPPPQIQQSNFCSTPPGLVPKAGLGWGGPPKPQPAAPPRRPSLPFRHARLGSASGRRGRRARGAGPLPGKVDACLF